MNLIVINGKNFAIGIYFHNQQVVIKKIVLLKKLLHTSCDKKSVVMKHLVKILISVLFYFIFFNSISCSDATTDSNLGKIAVMVVDNDVNGTPVPDVEITVMPINFVKMTDANGICNFEVEPGNYFVDAEVCCAGPGNIEYHIPVEVLENNTVDVKLLACLSCD